MTNQEALAIKIIRSEPETLALKIVKVLRNCSDCPAYDVCDESTRTCSETIEKWLKQKAEIERNEKND